MQPMKVAKERGGPPVRVFFFGHLENGLRLELVAGSDPMDADIAVCSADEVGSPGPLNRLVLKAVGFNAARLHEFYHPPTILLTRPPHSVRIPVLVVQAWGREPTPTLLERSFKMGLEQLREVTTRTLVWLPFLGTGLGGLSLEQSGEILIGVLSSWERGSTEVIRLAAPSDKEAHRLSRLWLGRWPIPPPPPLSPPRSQVPQFPVLSLGPKDMEHHVAQALRAARLIANDQPITALHVLTAIVSLGEKTSSKAFSKLRSLIQLEADSRVGGPSGAKNDEPLDPSWLGEELRYWLSWAQSHLSPGERSSLWGRDLVTAALLGKDETLALQLKDTPTPLEDVRDRWFHFVTSDPSSREHMDWEAWWRAAQIPKPGPRRAGYSTETDEGDDKLGVEAEAAAFARLILDEHVKPPLSIGLLGDWGSGKSFFIEQIKKQVAALRGQPGLYEHVVEIEFNAWHASDSNLWASLVTSIFDEIWQKVSVEGAKANPEEARKKLLHELDQAGGAVHEAEGQVELARVALAKAEADLQERRAELAWSRYVRSVSTENLREIARRVGWQEPLQLINDIERARSRLARSGERLRLMVAAMMERPGTTVALPMAILAALTTGALWALEHVTLPPELMQFARPLTTLAGGLGALLAPLKAAIGKVNKFVESLEKIESDYDKQLEATKGSEEATQVATARRELESAEATVTAARAHLAELQNQLAALDPGRRLGAFLQDRVQSTQYRAQQGIISLVHKDFQQLSKCMKEWREARAQGSSPPPADIKPFDRIIIYVDDLDRCRPEHVVHMLEAVHLLLALDLFVVVVAVDSRWLTRALHVHYRELLTALDGDGDEDDLRASTAQNYLEKIFQVTYALAPMDSNHFTGYVDFLTGSGAAPASRVEPSASVAPGPEDTKPSDDKPRISPPAQALSEAMSKKASTHQKTTPGDKKEPVPPDKVRLPPPHAVRIQDEERKFLYKLAPLLPTPRIAKRLVNVYRLIKASKSMQQLEEDKRAARYQSCLLMLAILFGRPAIASEFFRGLHERRPPFDKPEEKLVEAVRRRAPTQPPSATDMEGAQWVFLLQELERLQAQPSVGECAQEAREVARYSLVTGRDWHTWGTR